MMTIPTVIYSAAFGVLPISGWLAHVLQLK
jgi:hypothetical protein